MIIRFAFLCEGSSDEPLSIHLEELCLRNGASEVRGFPLNHVPEQKSKKVEDQLEALLQQDTDWDLIFIHRDPDSPDDSQRREELRKAVKKAYLQLPHVFVVPIQKTEAWLLLDEKIIRSVAENPEGRVQLNLPKASRVETVSSPKERLQEILITATQNRGRRLKRFKKRFPDHRRLLIDRLDIDGPISQVPAWQQLCKDIESTLATMRDVRKNTSN